MAVKVAIAIALIERLYGQGSSSESESGQFDRLGDRHKNNDYSDYQRKTPEIQTRRFVRTSPRLVSFNISCRPPS